jgi:hypothetical protein
VAIRSRELSPDAQGRFRPYLGWKQKGNNEYVQHRFNLGRDRESAERVMIRLRQLWQHVEATHTPNADSPRPVWDSQSLWIAEELAQGKVAIMLPRKPLDGVDSYARYFHRVQRHYPFVMFVPENQEEYEAGAQSSAERVEQRIDEIEAPAQRQIAAIEEATNQQIAIVEQKALRSGGLRSKRIPQNSETLHKALDAYGEYVRQTKIETNEKSQQPTVTAYGKSLVDAMARFKEHHDNISLSEIDFDAIQQMVDHWRNRPARKGTKRPIAARSAVNHVKFLMSFFRWLHRTKKFAWRKPEDFEDLETKVQLSASEIEDRATAEQVETYSIEELKTLYEYATPMERCLMLLGMNCGFAPSEQGTLRIKHLALRHEHPSADRLSWKTSPDDSFIKKLRNKTKVYGEWLLWDHTVKAIDWLVARRRKLGNTTNNSLLLVTASETPFYRLTGGGNRSQRFASIWSTLTHRARKDQPSFPLRSFGKLRKTGGNMVRRLAGGEIHSLYVCHGTPVKTDDLAELYSNRPFAKLFEALRKIEDELQPMWDAVPDPFGRYTQQYTSLSKVKRMKAMDQDGVPVAEIAEAVGVSRMTVYRHTKKQGVIRTRRKGRNKKVVDKI